jgi:hypothetical protein
MRFTRTDRTEDCERVAGKPEDAYEALALYARFKRLVPIAGVA